LTARRARRKPASWPNLADPEARGDPEVEDELAEGLGQGAVPLEDERRDREREHRAGRVVQG
jgi:hypothetical protein